MYKFAKKLWPINRSLTGAGLQRLGGLFSNPVSSRPDVISQLGPGYNTGFNI